MRAIRLMGPRLVEVVDVDAPTPQEGQVLVRAEYLSICGSDMRQYRPVHPEEMYPFPPGVPCHEIVGVVEESRAPGVTAGQRVIALPAGGAGGYGGGAELMLSTPERIILLPPDADPYTYIMCQPVGTVIFSAKKLGNMYGKTAAVLGQGAIGVTFTALLHKMGAREVVAIDRHDYRLAWSREQGATVTLNPDRDDVVAAAADLRSQASVDRVWVVGFGSGAALAICAAAIDDGISGVGSLAAPADWSDWAANPRRLLLHARDAGLLTMSDSSPDFSSWSGALRDLSAERAVSALAPRDLLLVHGGDDEIVPPLDARVVAGAHGAADLRIIDGAGHHLRHDPRAIAILLGWLDRQRRHHT